MAQNTNGNTRFVTGDDWEALESQRQRELDETRARAAQMEKTMKWLVNIMINLLHNC